METYFEKCKTLYNPSGNYNVLNHGDHHLKNLMFKIENGIVKDVCFVSFYNNFNQNFIKHKFFSYIRLTFK